MRLIIMSTSRPNITIRLAKEKDIAAIVKFINEVYAEVDKNAGPSISYRKEGETGARTTYSEILEKVASPSYGLFIAIDDPKNNQIIGTQCIKFLTPDEDQSDPSELTLFAIHRNYRGKGLGDLLSTHVEAKIAKMNKKTEFYNVTKIHAEVVSEQKALIQHYKTRGFLPTGKRTPFNSPKFSREVTLVEISKTLRPGS